MTVGDFNGDHKIDVAVSTSHETSVGQEIVFLGNGDGTFQSPVTSAGVSAPDSIVVGDFNGDGKADLLINSGPVTIGQSTIDAATYLLLGNGDGTFHASTIAFPSGGQVAALDVNGDGKLDVIFSTDSVVEIYLGKGDGTFSNTNNYALLSGANGGSLGGSLVIADFNLDGKMDIDAGGGVLLGNGDGTFQGVPLGLVPGFVTAFVTGQFDKTIPPSVAVVGGQTVGTSVANFVYVLRNNGGGALSLAHSYALQQPGLAIVTADFNGDGNLDLIVISAPPNTGTWGYSVLLGNGDGSFQPATFVSQNSTNPPVFQGNNSVVVADFNGDKKLDVAVGGFGDQTLAILLGNGDGTFGAPSQVFDAGAGNLLAADFNSDGKMDIAAPVGTANGGTYMLFGNGDGTFQPAVLPASLTGFFATVTADFNGDGKPDLFETQAALGNGDGTFTVLPRSATQYGAFQVADFNGDGKPDLLVGYEPSPTLPHFLHVAILQGNGNGTFGSLTELPALENQVGAVPAFAVSDMNGDGRPDILLPVPVDSTAVGVAVLFNTTPSGFALSASALSPATVTAGGSTTSTVTVSPSFGSSGSVTLSCVGLPSGASCQFSPASIAGASGTSSLTITTTSGVAAGTYPVKVQGTAGSLNTSATLSLVIQASVAADFTIAAPSPGSQTVAAGKSATFTLALAPSGSFSGTVNLSCAVTPAATRPPTCTLSTPSVQISSSGSQSVTATVATTAPTSTGAAPPVNLPPASLPLLWTLSLLSLAWLLLRYQKRQPILVPLLLVLAAASLAGCGGSSSPSPGPVPGTPTGTYTVTVTAASGSSTHSASLQVVVQ